MTDKEMSLMKNKIFYSAFIISSQVSKSFVGNEYVEYIIKINLLFNNWTIKRRYSDFLELNKKLQSKIANLPFLPIKRLFFNCSLSVINERVKLFDEYLAFIIKQCNFLKHPDIVSFLEISDDIINRLSRNQ